MIHIQIVSRSGSNLQTLIRKAIADGKIKSFEVCQVKGGVKIAHKKYPGTIKLTRSDGPLLAAIICKNQSKQFHILEAFIGRLAYHFSEQISAVNIQFSPQ